MGQGLHQAQDAGSRNEVGFHVECLQHLVHFEHLSQGLEQSRGACESLWARLESPSWGVELHKGQQASPSPWLPSLTTSPPLHFLAWASEPTTAGEFSLCSACT